MVKKVKKLKPVFAHGAVKSVSRQREWVYFGASVGDEDYLVVFQVKHLPELIRWLQAQLPATTQQETSK